MVEVGKYTHGQETIDIHYLDKGNLILGNFCSIGGKVNIYLGGNHMIDWATTFSFGVRNLNVFNNKISAGHGKGNGDVIIGSDVWIGDNVTIMSGVKIGHGAVIGNNAHVLENVKPYTVVGGNPAKFYFTRFNQEIIKNLLELKWWDLEDEKINDLLPLLCSSDFEKLFERCRELGYLK